jgi:hypothetical protein
MRIEEPPPWTISGNSITLTLSGTPTLEPGQSTIEPLDIQASARMPRGVVWMRSAVRPMFFSASADESDKPTSNKAARADVRPDCGLSQ